MIIRKCLSCKYIAYLIKLKHRNYSESISFISNVCYQSLNNHLKPHAQYLKSLIKTCPKSPSGIAYPFWNNHTHLYTILFYSPYTHEYSWFTQLKAGSSWSLILERTGLPPLAGSLRYSRNGPRPVCHGPCWWFLRPGRGCPRWIAFSCRQMLLSWIVGAFWLSQPPIPDPIGGIPP